jgi:hypothetical protein
MAFPKKFKDLIEIGFNDVESPDFVWVTYSVCATEKDSCGWGGWTIEWAAKHTKENYPTSTGDKTLSAMDEQICPKCGKDLFRTGASIKFEPSKDQTPIWQEGVNYESAPTEYEDD